MRLRTLDRASVSKLPSIRANRLKQAAHSCAGKLTCGKSTELRTPVTLGIDG